MRISLLVLGLSALCAVAIAQETNRPARGRERLRALVQKARAGDAEAKAILASRRRKVVRNQNENSASGSGRRGSAPSSRADAAVADVLRGPTGGRAQEPSRVRNPLTRLRSRARPTTTTQSEITTFRPSFTAAPTTTELPPQTEAPVQVTSTVLTEEQTLVSEPAQPQVADLTPTNLIPSIFQPAQFGPGGRGVQAGPEPVIREQSSFRQQRPVGRPTSRLQPHRAINRGLEIGTRTEVNQVEQDTENRVRTPPVQTTRRYAYFDEAGNYIFGYEAEDGSFKEEIRGLDCIVNGKYGYVDPTGIRREFTYVSGNKCDPNDPEGLLQQEGVTIPPNDQFLHQTDARALTDVELSDLAFNRRRRPTATIPTAQDTSVPQRASRPVSRPVTRPVSRPRTRPTSAPAPVRQEPERQAVDLTPSNAIPNMFKPAQFGSDGRGVAPQPDQERFPVPDFLSGSRTPEPAPAQRRPATPEPTRKPSPAPAKTNAPAKTDDRHVDLTPTNVIPSIFQPAQFGAGGRGVPASGNAVTRPPNAFNFQEEFRSVFSNFDNRGTSFPLAPSTRPAPRPTQPPATRPPTTRAPQPPTPTSAPRQNAIPSLFQPAQFGSNKPLATPAPIRAPIDDNEFTLAPQRPSTVSTSPKQLVFDASTGTFKTVQLQNQQNPFLAAAARASSQPIPTPRPSPPAARPANPPVTTHSFAATTGRPLQLFQPGASAGRNPLPPIPTSAAEFDSFFAQLG